MKRRFEARAALLGGVSAALLAGCVEGVPAAAVPDAAGLEREAARELDDLHAAAAAADEARYFAHFSPRAVFLGTDATERWDLPAFRAYAHPHFAAGKGWTYTPARRAVAASADGSVVWFDEDLKNASMGLARGSGCSSARTGGCSSRSTTSPCRSRTRGWRRSCSSSTRV